MFKIKKHAAKHISQKEKLLSCFEFCPNAIFYFPVAVYWTFKTLQHKGRIASLLANPRIETGGLCGESKTAILDMAGDYAQKTIAPYFTFRNGAYAFEQVQTKLRERNFSFPLVLKPDIGSNGTGVRKIQSLKALQETLPLFPYGTTLIIQALVDFPLEAGVFFFRYPNEKQGKITSITYKEVPTLTGDGSSSLMELAIRDPRIKKLLKLYLPYLSAQATRILLPGEKFPVVFAGNHRKGAIFWNGSKDLTPELAQSIHKILLDIPHFFFGRIDLKAKSKADFLKGENFKIIEINGVGSEAIHIWDRKTKLIEAYRDQFHHYDIAFRIGNRLKKQAWKNISPLTLLKAWHKHRHLSATYPKND